ncbi:MAG: LolA family protein [Maricaulaceae bacterium]
MKKWFLISAVALLGGQAAVYAQSAQFMQGNAQAYSPFTDAQRVPADLAKVDSSLNYTTSFQGRFAQYGADGSVARGKIYLKRPGRLRFEYDSPSPMLIVSDGTWLTQHDSALQTTDRVPLSSTPLNFFLKENVQLSRDTEVVGLTKDAQEWRVSARDGSGEMDGTITMVFNAQNLALKEWVIADGFGGNTRVVLSDLAYNQPINPRLFIMRDDSRRDRRR